jgi:hypothetical protein
MKKVNDRYINSMVKKMLNETLEERADDLVTRLKTNVNEKLGGMDDGHPRFGKKNFTTMTPEEIEAMMDEYINSDDEGDDSDFEDGVDERPHRKPRHDYDDEEFENELEEGFDDPYIQRARGGKDFTSKEFKRIPKNAKINMDNLRDDSITPGKYVHNKFKDIDDMFKKRFGHDDDEDENLDDINLDDLYEDDTQICECGGNMSEGECMECGKSYMDEGIHDVDDLDESNEYDYVEEGLLDDEGDEATDYLAKEPDTEACNAHRKLFGPNHERTQKFCKGVMNERLSGRQRNIDKNKNGKIDSEDFKMLRGKKSETKESLKGGQSKIDKNKNGKIDSEDFKMLRNKKSSKESVKLTESEMIELIENIVKEEQKLKSFGKPKGLSKYEEIHKKDGKENEEYLRSVAKKMKEYLKDGSKGDYEENPKHFPKGNGQLAKMAAKKYTMSDNGKDFIDDFMSPGMEDLVPDEIEYDEKWVEDNIKGSSRTGNDSKYANAEETDLGDNLVKKLKAKKYHKAKELAYRKSKQPVTDGTGENAGSGTNIKLESNTKEGKILNEEFSKIQHLMGYDRKTQ